MSDTEMRLRALMNIAVGDPPRRISTDAVRRGAARRRIAMATVVATAVALAVGIGTAAALSLIGQGPAERRHPHPAGMPRYYLTQGLFGVVRPGTTQPTGGQVTVRATATGAVTGSVRCPWQPSGAIIISVAPANDRVFFMVCRRVAAAPRGVTVSSRIYRFWLTGSGRVGGYSLVPGGVLNGISAGDIAATPDGSRLAVILAAGASPGFFWHGNILVIDTRTGRAAQWRDDGLLIPGTTRLYIRALSFTADGQELAFLAEPTCVGGPGVSRCARAITSEQVRVLRLAASGGPGGQISQARTVFRLRSVRSTYLDDAVISPDGTTVTLAVQHQGNGSGPASLSLVRYSAATGRPMRVLFRLTTSRGSNFQFVSADPSARYFLLDIGNSTRQVIGWVRHGRLVQLRPSGSRLFNGFW